MWRVLDKAGRAGRRVLGATERWLEPTAELVLRVPSLLVLDYCWRFELDGDQLQHGQFGVFNSVMAASLLLQALAVLLLPLPYVVRLYMHYISGALLVLSHQFSYYHISGEVTQPAAPGLAAFFHVVPVWQLWSPPPAPGDGARNWSVAGAPSAALPVQFLRRQLAAMAVHLAAAALVIVLLEVDDIRRRVSLLAHTVPVVALMADVASGAQLMLLHSCAGAVTILSCLTWLVGCVPACVDYYHQLFLKYYFHATMVYDARELAVQLWWTVFSPRLLLGYWLCLALTQLPAAPVAPLHVQLLSVLAGTVGSPLSLASFCVAGGYLSWAVVKLLRVALKAPPPADGRAEHTGWLEASLMLLLSIQVDLIHQELAARRALVAVALFVAVISTGQAVYEACEAAVLAMVASGGGGGRRHAAAAACCLLLAALPVRLTQLLLRLFGGDLWALVLGSSALTLTLQAAGLLAVHAVCVWEALRRRPGPPLDAVVYAARAAAALAQLLVAVLVVTTGVYESARGHWSWASAGILAAHSYFNVWRRLRAGWAQFLRRRAAARTADTLPTATRAQLTRHADVCAVCYSAMSEARLLPCRHLFHSVCLRKWLYVQSTCPMCQTAVLAPSERAGRDGGESELRDGRADEEAGERSEIAAPEVGTSQDCTEECQDADVVCYAKSVDREDSADNQKENSTEVGDECVGRSADHDIGHILELEVNTRQDIAADISTTKSKNASEVRSNEHCPSGIGNASMSAGISTPSLSAVSSTDRSMASTVSSNRAAVPCCPVLSTLAGPTVGSVPSERDETLPTIRRRRVLAPLACSAVQPQSSELGGSTQQVAGTARSARCAGETVVGPAAPGTCADTAAVSGVHPVLSRGWGWSKERV